MLILVAVFAFGWRVRADDDSISTGLHAALLAILISSMFASFTLVEFLLSLDNVVGLLVASDPGGRSGSKCGLQIAARR